MAVPSVIARGLALVRRAVEGVTRPGPWYLPLSGGVLSAEAGQYLNWWQLGHGLQPTGRSAMVEACISAYAQTVAMCPGDHWRATDDGGRERVDNSAAARLLRKPNSYQSISDFLLNLTRQLYANGNAYALALRNDRYEADELHLMSAKLSRPRLSQDGEVFYQLAGNEVIARQLGGEAGQQLMVPARDVLHVRLNARRSLEPWPLIGETPLAAVYGDLISEQSMMSQQHAYYLNQARPSAVLQTDLVLDKDQVADLRARWEEQSKGLKAGGTPILTAGLKVNPWGGSAKDDQLAELLKLSEQNIALAFRVPLQILGLGNSTMGSTEALMANWLATGLGFALNHIEEALGLFFRLDGQPYEYIEFSTDALLRSAFKDRMGALTQGVLGGVYSPNEARVLEGLDKVPFGDEPRLQAQVVPLSAAGKIEPAPVPPSAPPASSGDKPAKPAPPWTEELNPYETSRALANLRAAVARANDRFR